MAEKTLVRRILAVFDRQSAKKSEQEFKESLAKAGAEGGKAFLRELRAAFDKRMAELKVQLAAGIIDKKEFRKQADAAAKEFNAGLLKGMEKARRAGELTDKEYLKLSRTLKTVGVEGATAGSKIGAAFLKAGGAIAAFLTIDRAVRFLRQSISAFLESEQTVARLDSALGTLGLSYRQVSGEVESYLDTLQKTTRFSDEDGREALSRLITITGDYQTALRLLDLTANIAEKRQTTMAEAAQTAGDASRGLTKGMKDLGIAAGETGDIVAKLERNLGDIARETDANSRTIAMANNLWGEFQEKLGGAILGSNGMKDSSTGLIGALVDLNEWVEKNSASITKLTDQVFGLGRTMIRLAGIFVKLTTAPGRVELGRELARWVRGDADGADQDAEAAIGKYWAGMFARAKTLGKRTRELTKEEIEEQKRLEKARADELERTETELAILRIQTEQGVTEAQAREQAQRDRLLSGHAARQKATIEEVIAAWKRLEEAQTAARLGAVDITPRVARTGQVSQTEASLAIGPLAIPEGGAPFAPDQKPIAKQFVDPWFEAMHLLREEVEGQGSLFAELGQAWAEGGLAGLAKLAAGKVKENIARAIEEAAKAFGSLALGNPGGAALHAKAAAGHTAGAAAWKVLGGALGGGGSGAGTAGGVATGAGPVSQRPDRIQPQKPEVHIYLNGPGFDATNPKVQRVVFGAMQNARERYGDAIVTLHRGEN